MIQETNIWSERMESGWILRRQNQAVCSQDTLDPTAHRHAIGFPPWPSSCETKSRNHELNEPPDDTWAAGARPHSYGSLPWGF